MSSNINPYNIDGTFPIAGQDNSSQGFRDNFTNIQTNFNYAASEISDLQSKVIVTSALNGQSINNDMAGTQIKRPQLASWTQSLIDLGVVSSSATLDFSQANFQKITTAGPITLGFANWPATTGSGALGYAVMRVWIVVTDVAHTVTLPTSVQYGVTDIAGYNASTQTITFDVGTDQDITGGGNYIFDFSSIDGGTTFQIIDVTRNRSTFRDPNIYFNPKATTVPTLFLGYGANGGGQTALNLAIAGDQGQNTLSILGPMTSAAIGNLSLANNIQPTLDTGKISGYTITSARGNLALSTITAVQSGDYLGYFNAVSYSGNQYGNANVFQQMATIDFYATGSNVQYGLGGNIAFFTADDGGSVPSKVYQAMSINNDQSVEIMGRLKTDNGIIEAGTYFWIAATSGASLTANANISTIIIESSSSANVAYANITLPSNPVNGQKLTIASAPVILNANINAPNAASVRYIPTNKFVYGNTSIQLTYISTASAWYLS